MKLIVMNLMKNKTLSGGKNFLEDTKNYQNKKWLKEKVMEK